MPPGVPDTLSEHAEVQLAEDALTTYTGETDVYTGERHVYCGKLAKRGLDGRTPSGVRCLPARCPDAPIRSSTAHRALALECLRIVGASGYLSDEEGDDEDKWMMEENLEKEYPELMIRKKIARQTVCPLDLFVGAAWNVQGKRKNPIAQRIGSALSSA